MKSLVTYLTENNISLSSIIFESFQSPKLKEIANHCKKEGKSFSSIIKDFGFNIDFANMPDSKIIEIKVKSSNADANSIYDKYLANNDNLVFVKDNETGLFSCFIKGTRTPISLLSKETYDKYDNHFLDHTVGFPIGSTVWKWTPRSGDLPLSKQDIIKILKGNELYVISLDKTASEKINQRIEQKKDAYAMLQEWHLKALNVRKYSKFAYDKLDKDEYKEKLKEFIEVSNAFVKDKRIKTKQESKELMKYNKILEQYIDYIENNDFTQLDYSYIKDVFKNVQKLFDDIKQKFK